MYLEPKPSHSCVSHKAIAGHRMLTPLSTIARRPTPPRRKVSPHARYAFRNIRRLSGRSGPPARLIERRDQASWSTEQLGRGARVWNDRYRPNCCDPSGEIVSCFLSSLFMVLVLLSLVYDTCHNQHRIANEDGYYRSALEKQERRDGRNMQRKRKVVFAKNITKFAVRPLPSSSISSILSVVIGISLLHRAESANLAL
jgi:hypothetical protein